MGGGVSWADVEEDVKKQEVDAREQEERIKEAQRLYVYNPPNHAYMRDLEEQAAMIPEHSQRVLKKDFEEFVNTDWNEDSNDNGFAVEDGLMLDPLETLKQCQVKFIQNLQNNFFR